MKKIFSFIVTVMVISQPGFNQKVFKNAEGFGTQTRAAYGGSAEPAILIVDTLSPGIFPTGDKRGTLRWALSQNYPRIIVFEVGGTIDFSGIKDGIIIKNPYLSVYGQTAPSPGIIIRGSMFYISTTDVLIQNIKFRIGDDVAGLDPNARDCISLSGARRVVIDHCSMEWSVDELIGLGPDVDDITVSNCIIAEALAKSIHYDKNAPEWHAYGILNYDGAITIKDNLIAFTFGRNPMVNSGTKAIINNFMYTTRNGGPMIYGNLGSPVYASVIGNYIEPIANCELNQKATYNIGLIMPDVSQSSQIFLSDNMCRNKVTSPGSSDWDNMLNLAGLTPATSSPVNLTGYTIKPSSRVESYVLEHAGAFRWDRDYVDSRVVSNVKNRSGKLVDSPFSTPAMAFKWEINRFEGVMNNGYDWSANPKTLVINGTTLTLNQKCTDINQVITYLNSLLPSGIEAFRLNSYLNLDFVGFRTVAKGSGQILSISGNACDILGITAGTFYGSDGNGYNFGTAKRSLMIPASPHSDSNGDGFTSLEEWAFNLGNPGTVPSNHSPVIDAKTITVKSNASTGVLTTIPVTEPDAGQTHTFTLISGNTDGYYSINNSGQLMLVKSYTVTQDVTHNLVVKAADNGTGNLSDTARITVHVSFQAPVPVNHSPVIDAKTITVKSNAPTGVLTTIPVTDPDAGQTHTFTLISGNTDGYYSINNSGQILLIKSYTVTQDVTHNLVIKATDNGTGNLSDTARITVHVSFQAPVPVNHPPVINAKTITVKSDAPTGVLTTIPVTDPDAGQTHTFTLISGNTDGYYSINNSGQILLIKSYTVTQDITHNLVIKAADNGTGNLSDTARITVHVSFQAPVPVNHPPVIDAGTFYIRRNSPAGTLLGNISFYDPDEGQKHYFNIIAGNTDNNFTVTSSGDLYLKRKIESSTKKSFELILKVRDDGAGELFDTTKVTIIVSDQNRKNNPPEISSQWFVVNEGNPTSIGYIQAFDEDSGQQISYSITEGNQDGHFTIDSTTGLLSVSGIQENRMDTVTLTVQVEDNGEESLSNEAEVDIIFVPENTSSSKESFVSERIQIFPNPSHGTFTIRNAGQIGEIRIYDTEGRLIFGSCYHQQNEIRIDLENTGKGIYLIKLVYPLSIITERLIVF